eukprot:scaffold4455_cov143-Skeletonema_menzelii.AAC.2
MSTTTSTTLFGKKEARAQGNARKGKTERVKKVKDDVIEVDATVIESLPNAMFRCTIDGAPETQEPVLATISGKIRKFFVKILVGDKVTIELSPMDAFKWSKGKEQVDGKRVTGNSKADQIFFFVTSSVPFSKSFPPSHEVQAETLLYFLSEEMSSSPELLSRTQAPRHNPTMQGRNKRDIMETITIGRIDQNQIEFVCLLSVGGKRKREKEKVYEQSRSSIIDHRSRRHKTMR